MIAWERNVVIKSEQEIEVMREAGRINAKALQDVKDAIRPGVTTKELDEIAETVIREHNAKPAFLGYPGPTPYPGTINSCINEEMVHAIPSKKRVVQEGDLSDLVRYGDIVIAHSGENVFQIGQFVVVCGK